MPNNRIYYACYAVGLAPLGSTTFTEIHGLQNAGISLNFELEDILEIGQVEPYESKETTPQVEVTLEKVLDGYPLIYHLATRGYAANTFTGRQNQRTTVAMSVFGDTQSSASGTPITEIQASGTYWSNITYTFGVDGPFTEAVTLVGNNLTSKQASFDFSGDIFDNTDLPLAYNVSGGVQTKQNLIWEPTVATLDVNSQVQDPACTILPPDVYGISSSGTNNKTGDVYGAHVQSISVSIDVGRDELNELGTLGPYYRFAQIPTEVTCDIEIYSIGAHTVVADENSTSNLTNRSIRIYTQEGTLINLGTNNKLTSVVLGGGDTGGSNQTVTFSYRNLNSFTVTHPQDPVA